MNMCNNKVYIKNSEKLVIMKHSLIQYGLFAIFLMCIILRNSNIWNKSKSEDITQHVELDFTGIECAYEVLAKPKIRAWEKTRLFIKYNIHNSCPKDILYSLERKGGSVFRIQAYSIFEMFSATTRYVGNETYIVDILLTFPVKYIVMVILTYVNNLALEPRYHVKPILKQLRKSPFNLIVGKSDVPRGLSSYCSGINSGVLSGRWVKCGGSLPGLERCGPWQAPEFDFDHIHGFRWLPYSCQYHQYTNDQIKRCFARKGFDSIVFAGDSHMRYRAYHWVTRLYGSCHTCVKTHIKMVFNKVPRIEWIFDARGTRLPLSFSNISLPYEKYIHPKVRRSKFSTPFPSDAINSKLFIFNFGHWLLREVNDENFIRQKIEAYAAALQLLQNQGKTVVWVNTMSLPWRTDKSVVEWRENTSPYRVRKYNKLTDDIMRQYGVPIVNAFQISDGRIAATHDQTHFTKSLSGNDFGGAVENAVTMSLFNMLCNE